MHSSVAPRHINELSKGYQSQAISARAGTCLTGCRYCGASQQRAQQFLRTKPAGWSSSCPVLFPSLSFSGGDRSASWSESLSAYSCSFSPLPFMSIFLNNTGMFVSILAYARRGPELTQRCPLVSWRMLGKDHILQDFDSAHLGWGVRWAGNLMCTFPLIRCVCALLQNHQLCPLCELVSGLLCKVFVPQTISKPQFRTQN